MTVGITKVSDLNSLFSQIYEDALFVARETNLMTRLVHHYSARGWMARNISIRPTIEAAVKAEGQDFASPTVFGKSLKATLTPAMYMAQAILTDEELATDPDETARDAASELGNAIASKIDKDLLEDFNDFTTDKGPGAGTAASIAKFAGALTYLRAKNVPNPIRVVLHPYAWLDIWTELGTPAGNIEIDDDDDVVNGVFNPGALAFDSRKAPAKEVERDPSRLAYEYNMSAGYAHGVRRDEFGVGYTCDATEPS